MPSFEQILYEIADGIATVTLNRPDRLNAWTHQMEKEVQAAVARAEADDQVRVIVLTGAGRGWAASQTCWTCSSPPARSTYPRQPSRSGSGASLRQYRGKLGQIDPIGAVDTSRQDLSYLDRRQGSLWQSWLQSAS